MSKLQKVSVKILKKDSYLAMIKNACGSVMWANNYALVNGKREDIVHNGATSCAFFVTSILKIFNLIKELHLTVKSAEKDLKESGWQIIKVSSKMPEGSVIIWKKQLPTDKELRKKEKHYHIGFYLGEEKAVSIWAYHNFPVIHHWTYYGARKIIRAYWNPQIKN
jgi:hypothetical protein